MDNINFADDIQPGRMNYDSELSEFDHDVDRVSRSLLLELIDKKTVGSGEQRAYERFQVNKDAFALIRPAASEEIGVTSKSMAEIACAVYRSKPVRFGRINNISMGGFRFVILSARSGPINRWYWTYWWLIPVFTLKI